MVFSQSVFERSELTHCLANTIEKGPPYVLFLLVKFTGFKPRVHGQQKSIRKQTNGRN